MQHLERLYDLRFSAGDSRLMRVFGVVKQAIGGSSLVQTTGLGSTLRTIPSTIPSWANLTNRLKL